MTSMFSFSEKLFQLANGGKMEFVVIESSRDAAIVSRLIKLGGGSVSVKPDVSPNAINLCCFYESWMRDFVIFNTSYVFACCAVNKKISLKKYSLGKVLSNKKYKEFDQLHVYLGYIPSKSLSIPSNRSSNVQEYTQNLPKYDGNIISGLAMNKENENRLSTETVCVEGTPLSCILKNEKIHSPKNSAYDVVACVEIYPKDSVSQAGEGSVDSSSSSVEESSILSESNDSSQSEWSRSVKIWISDNDVED